MRIVRYLAPGASGPAVGIVDGNDSISEVPGSGGDLGVLLLLDAAGLDRVASTAMVHHALGDVRLLSPIGAPGKQLMLAGNYHPTDTRKDVNVDIETPQVFTKPSSSLLGPDDEIPYNELVVHQIEEIELGVVIGRPGKNISRDEAFDHIFGYTIMNDYSARELRFSPDRSNPDRTHWFDWLNGKWLDGYCPVGPWIVDAASVKDPENLSLTTKINGKVIIDSNTNRMIFDIRAQIAYISSLCTLEPGDLISTGVALGPSGARETLPQPGDVVEGDVEGIGTLRNTVGKPG